jgi:hypothetical protein
MILKGVVVDSLQTPLAYANIIATPQEPSKNIKFTITEANGTYLLELEKRAYTISVSFMGYETYNFEVKISNEDIVKNITLKEQVNALEEIKIEMPITVKQDTIIYNTDKFITGDERKLKNVLKKLPGVEVEKDGTVTVQGKKVTTMLVEGKKFFGGGTKLAIDNIPANVIAEVEVLDNYNEIAFLKNFVDSNEMAMNIKLKENKKSFVFGDIEASKGNKDFYSSRSNVFYYGSKTQINSIANINNVGEEVFTFKNYLDFNGGINQIFKDGSTNFKKATKDLSQFIDSKDVVQKLSKFAALNVNQEINTKFNISGYGIFSYAKEEIFTEFINQYNTYTELKENVDNAKNNLGIGNLSIKYLPNLSSQWYFRTQFKKARNRSNNFINSKVDTVNSRFYSQINAIESYFNQNIEWHNKTSNKHTLSFVADYTFQKNTPITQWETPDNSLEGFLPLIEQSNYNIVQSKKQKHINFDVIFKHYWIINQKNHVYSTIGNTYLKQHFFTDDKQILIDGNVNDFSENGFGNDLGFDLNDLFFGINYKVRAGIFTFNQGVFFHKYKWKTTQIFNNYHQKLVALPSFLTKIQFNKARKIEVNYRLNSSFSDVSKLTNRFYLQSYNSVYRGNENLSNELYHSVNVRYSKFSLYKGLRFYINANFEKKLRGIVESVNYQDNNQYLSPLLLDDAETKWRVNGSLKKKIKNVNYKLGLNLKNSNYLQQVNTSIEKNKNRSIGFELSAKTLFDNFPTIEIGYKQSIGKYILSNQKSKFISTEPFLNVDYDFLKGFIFSLDYSLNKYKALNQNNTFDLANMSLYYRGENSAWSFSVEGNNVFNAQYKNVNWISSYIVSDVKTYILPRIIMFSIGYNL